MIDLTQGEIIKTNLSAILDPMTTDDITKGYTVGSVWVNVDASPRRVFVLTRETTNAAIWIQTSNTNDNSDSPGLYFLGSVLDYSIAGGLPSGEVQYSRVFLLAGLVITSVEVFVDSGGTANRNLRVGIYDQASPSLETGLPRDRLAQSNSTPTGATDGTYFTINLTSPLAIPQTGFYWLAVASDSASLKLIVTGTVYRENYPPTRRQTVTGTTLPATTSGLSNPSSAIAFVAAKE